MRLAWCVLSFFSCLPLSSVCLFQVKSSQVKRKALLAAGLAFALVGCGGGSSTTPMPMTQEPDPDPTPAEMEDDARKRITDANADAKSAIAAVTNTVDDNVVATANRQLQALKDAIDGAEALRKSERDIHMASLYDARKKELDDKKEMRTTYIDGEEQRRTDETTAAAMKWVHAINAYEVGKGNLHDDLMGTKDLKVEYKDGSTQITLNNSKGTAITPTTATSPATGWTAKRFVETAGKSHGVIITNRVGPETTVKPMEFPEFAAGNQSSSDGLFGVTVDDTSGVVTFMKGFGIKKNYFETTPGAILAGEEQKNVVFLGVSGTLMCHAAADCTIGPRGATNEFSFAAGTVTFTPDDKNVSSLTFMIPETDPNDEYLAFGYWLTTTGSGNNMKHMIDIYAADGQAFTDSALGEGYGAPLDIMTSNPLLGSASYSGGAAGVYVLETGQLSDPDLHNGEFVADVTLTAQFGDSTGTVAHAKQWHINGNIDNFRSVTTSSATEHNLSAWDLALSADFGPRDTNTNEVTPPTSWGLTRPITRGGDVNGSWQASFHGNAGTDTDTTTSDGAGGTLSAAAAAADDHPAAIVGEFNGHFSNGHVVGAFGVEKD